MVDGEHHEEQHDEHDEFHSAFSTADETNSQGEKLKPPWDGSVVLATLLVNFASLSGPVTSSPPSTTATSDFKDRILCEPTPKRDDCSMCASLP